VQRASHRACVGDIEPVDLPAEVLPAAAIDAAGTG
jgi:hypothetical protein